MRRTMTTPLHTIAAAVLVLIAHTASAATLPDAGHSQQGIRFR